MTRNAEPPELDKSQNNALQATHGPGSNGRTAKNPQPISEPPCRTKPERRGQLHEAKLPPDRTSWLGVDAQRRSKAGGGFSGMTRGVILKFLGFKMMLVTHR